MDGILNINKPPGITSHDVVQQVRRLLKERRVGHTGTLDPLATGVLVVCVGKATRIAQYLEAGVKEYDAVLQLGVTTDTLDREGQVLETRTYTPADPSRVLSVLQSLTGTIMQTPPVYSALKVGGVPSYKLARQGKASPLQPRPVTIHRIELTRYADPFITIKVLCAKGVYIRSLCADIGEALGMGAHMVNLVRSRSGRFSIEDSVFLDQLARMPAEDISRVLVGIDNSLDDMPSITVMGDDTKKILHGNRIRQPAGASSSENCLVRIHSEEGRLLALGKIGAGDVRPELVFSESFRQES
jgi:tRNA pseudouridine55 synthase